VLANRCAAAALAAFLPMLAAAQSGAPPVPPDSSQIIRAVEVRRLNVFSPTEATSFLTRLANSLHRTTRASVVNRELLFATGAAYDSARVAETERNLRSVGVFRRVHIDSIRTDSGLTARVTTADGWTTRPDFRFGSTGSSVYYTVALEELNFLGTATYVALRYRKNPDRTILLGSFRQARMFRGNVGLSLQYADLSDGTIANAGLSKPFFALTDRTSWGLATDVRSTRVLRFLEGQKEAHDSLQRRYAIAYGSTARALRASPQGYLRIGVSGQLRRDDYAEESRPDTLSRSWTGAVGGFLLWRRAHYLVSRGLTAFGREEDVDISTAIGLGLNLTPKVFGYADNGVVPAATILTGFGQVNHFVQLFGTGALRFSPAGLDSGSVQLAATGFLVPAPRHLAVFHVSGGWQSHPAPGAEFDLGLGLGPRAFRQHAFTGDRAFLGSAEYRFTLTNEALKLSAIGLGTFVDYGGAWWHDSPRRTGWDFGVGLRFGPTRATNTKSTRVDLAYRVKNDAQPGGWVFVVGAGFAFSSSYRLAP
jgi:hypothetical protein